MKKLVCTALLTGLLSSLAADSAAYQVTGRFLYRDRDFGPGGFTSNDTDQPIRLADVEVLDNDTNVVLASGATDGTGNFSIQVIDFVTRNVRVRVKSIANNTSNLDLQVLQTGSSAIFAVSTSVFSNHDPGNDIDFTSTPVVALQGAGGEPFNVFDQMLYGFDFVASLEGTRPSQLLTVFWASGTGDGTYYRHSDRSIHLLGLTSDSDGYDDSVILHELGHFVEFNLADSDNPGGPHTLNGRHDPSLTWSEGFATFLQNMVRDSQGLARADIYVDTRGQPGPGQVLLSYEVETPSVGVLGSDNEVTVNALLWDLFDRASTADASQGTDDDPLQITGSTNEFWEVFTDYIPTATTISLEDFWDGWFSPSIDNGFATEMRQIFSARDVEYFLDDHEPNGSSSEANSVVANNPPQPTHHTYYGVGDEDWSIVAIAAGETYTFRTTNVLSDADTDLDLFASDGTTLLAMDETPGLSTSRITWSTADSAIVYLRCRRSGNHNYGSYDLEVSGLPVAIDVSKVRISSSLDRVELRWVATENLFTHFDVERGDASTGPFTLRNSGPIIPDKPQGSSYRFMDAGVQPGQRYFYRLVGVESSGARRSYGPFEALATVPRRFLLKTPYPNPFNPSTTISIELPSTARVLLRVVSATGRVVRTIENSTLPPGQHPFEWDGRDDDNRPLASGVYWVHFEASGEHHAKRAVLIR